MSACAAIFIRGGFAEQTRFALRTIVQLQIFTPENCTNIAFYPNSRLLMCACACGCTVCARDMRPWLLDDWSACGHLRLALRRVCTFMCVLVPLFLHIAILESKF